MARPASKYDIPCVITARVGNAAPFELGSAPVPWPYDAASVMAELLRYIADDLERQARER